MGDPGGDGVNRVVPVAAATFAASFVGVLLIGAVLSDTPAPGPVPQTTASAVPTSAPGSTGPASQQPTSRTSAPTGVKLVQIAFTDGRVGQPQASLKSLPKGVDPPVFGLRDKDAKKEIGSAGTIDGDSVSLSESVVDRTVCVSFRQPERWFVKNDVFKPPSPTDRSVYCTAPLTAPPTELLMIQLELR